MNTLSIYEKRRLLLTKTFSRTLFIIPSGEAILRSHSVKHRHKTASDFYYLTGVEIAGATLLIAKDKSYLFCDNPENRQDLWGDLQTLDSTSLQNSQFLETLHHSRLSEVFRSCIGDLDRVAAPIGRSSVLDLLLLKFLSFEQSSSRRTSSRALELCDSRLLTGSLRLKKNVEEIALLREAGRRSSVVHRELMSLPLLGKTELQVAQWIETKFAELGMHWTAYETIVGSAERSTILHAKGTARVIQDNEVVLIDAGGEWQGYCSDITRTLPSGLKFTSRQRDIYTIVLEAQGAGINAVSPGTSLQSLHETVQAVLCCGLQKLGLDHKALKTLMPHSTSHWMGLDVHDPCPYVDDCGNPLSLEEGMSFTLEPGLYFKDWGFGVRIEDDIAVTSKGGELFTSAPKTIEEIEELRANSIVSK